MWRHLRYLLPWQARAALSIGRDLRTTQRTGRVPAGGHERLIYWCSRWLISLLRR